VELKFYLLFSVVVLLGVTYRRVVAFCACWMIATIYASATNFYPLAAIVESRFAPYFIIGILPYLIHRFGPNLLLGGTLLMAVLFSVVSLQSRPVANNASLVVTLPIMFGLFALMAAVSLGMFS
jgi:hypothetical protein